MQKLTPDDPVALRIQILQEDMSLIRSDFVEN